MKQKNILIAIGVLLVAGVAAFFAFGGSFGNTGPVAVVNGEEIPRKDFNFVKSQVEQRMALQGQSADSSAVDEQVVNQLVAQELLLQEARGQEIEVTQEEIDEQYQNVIDQAGGEEALDQAFKNLGLSEEYIRNDIEEQLLIQKYLTQERGMESFSVTEQEIQEFYGQLTSQQSAENVLPLSEVRSQIKSQLLGQKEGEFVSGIVSTLRENAEIEILL